MNKKYLNLIICFLILISLFEIFHHSDIIYKTIYSSTKLWYLSIIPSILPIYIISDLLINYGIIDYLNKIFKKFMKIFFNLKEETSFVFFMSIISGFPSNSKYLKKLLDLNIINIDECNKLLCFTHFSNPLFIISSIGSYFLHNKKIGIIILIIHYLTNIIIGFFYKNYYINNNINNYKKNNINKLPFIKCLSNSILETIKTLFLIYGIITFFMLLTTIIKENINLNNNITSFLCGILEITQGINYISNLNINIIYKATLITFLLSFGGISIHIQVTSILSDYKINYYNYLISRIIHAIISSSLVYLILKFMLL